MLELNKVYNMDCMEGLKLIDDNSIDLILTDPPYDVGFDKKQDALLKIKKLSSKKMDSYKHYVEFKCDYKMISFHFWRVIKDNSNCLIFCSDNQIHRWIFNMKKAGFKFRQVLVWRSSPKFDLTRGLKYPSNSEFILYFQKGYKKLKYKRIPNSKFRNCFEYKSIKNKENEWHMCPKPYELLKDLILSHSEENDVLLDCFAGSGEHLTTCIKIRRRFIGFEISKEYCDKIQKRIDFNSQQRRLI